VLGVYVPTLHNREKECMVSAEAVGRLAVMLVAIVLPCNMLREYIHAKRPKRRALIGLIILALLAVLTVLSIIFVPTSSFISFRNPRALFVVPFDLEFLIYCWTSPSETWTTRRRNRGNLIILSAVSVLLLSALMLILFG
jgi:hypothetical protein